MRADPERRGGRRPHQSHVFRIYHYALAVGVVVVAASCASPTTTAPQLSRSRPGSTPTTSQASPALSTTTRPSTTEPATATTVVPAAAWSLVTEPNDGMQPIYSLMSSARHELDMTMYELADPQAVGILEADAARGVIVRVILDRDYSGGAVNAAAYAGLSSHGVHVRWAPASTIFHQKTITVDDHTSAVMTLNLTSEYYSSSRDFAVVTTDHADVAAIEQVFGTDWTNSGPPQAGAPGTNLIWSPGAEAPIVALIQSAHRSLLVENEEMDDADVADALEAAARRGVDVQVVMTYSSSWASEFDDLVAAGVKVSTYASDASLYIHAKVIVADGTTAFLGSQNFSASSLDYNRELGIITTERGIVGSIAKTVTSDFDGAAPFGAGGSPGGSSPPTTQAASGGPACQASASPADDGYSGDYNVYVHSNQPNQKATASDSGDTYSYSTNGSGYAVIYLWNTSAGETITVTVGGATCSTTA
jgi:cardiolipin synthase A/B